MTEEDDDIVKLDLLNMPSGAIPEIIPLTSPQDEITRVVNEITALVKSGIPKKDILVIHADWLGCDRLLERLQRELGEAAAKDPKDAPPGDHIQVCTLNAVTGLESPIVSLVGMRDLYEQEQGVRLSDEERQELIRDNTRKLYMAATRAGQRLVLTYVGDPPDALLIAAPQYNYSFPSVLKNALDWASRPPKSPLNGKPVARMSASTGNFGAVHAELHLRQVCVLTTMHPLNKPEVLVTRAMEKSEAEGRLTDEATRNHLRNLLIALAAWSHQLHP